MLIAGGVVAVFPWAACSGGDLLLDRKREVPLNVVARMGHRCRGHPCLYSGTRRSPQQLYGLHRSPCAHLLNHDDRQTARRGAAPERLAGAGDAVFDGILFIVGELVGTNILAWGLGIVGALTLLICAVLSGGDNRFYATAYSCFGTTAVAFAPVGHARCAHSLEIYNEVYIVRCQQVHSVATTRVNEYQQALQQANAYRATIDAEFAEDSAVYPTLLTPISTRPRSTMARQRHCRSGRPRAEQQASSSREQEANLLRRTDIARQSATAAQSALQELERVWSVLPRAGNRIPPHLPLVRDRQLLAQRVIGLESPGLLLRRACVHCR